MNYLNVIRITFCPMTSTTCNHPIIWIVTRCCCKVRNMQISPLNVFCRVVELSSFRKAAEELGVPVSTASQQVQSLEKRLGVRLLVRSTRKVEPTFEGFSYYQRIAPLLEGIEEASDLLVQSNGLPKGQLSISAPASVVRTLIVPALTRFTTAYPGITLRFIATDSVLNVAEQGLDCVIRAAQPSADGLTTRSLGRIPQFFAASPSLIARLGMPQTLSDIAKYPFVNYGVRHNVDAADIEAFNGQRRAHFTARAVVSVDDGDAYMAFAKQGFGAIQAPPYDLYTHLRDGTLVLLLPEWRGPALDFFAIYAKGRQLLPRVRLFVDWMQGRLEQAACCLDESGQPIKDALA